MIVIVLRSHASQAGGLGKRRKEPMKEYNEKLNLGKGSAFVKSRLSRLPRTEEVWEADIQPISPWGWDALRHGELWLGMVVTQAENFHLALLASEAAPGINDLASLLAKAMEHPWVMGKQRPTRIVLRDNPQWEELIPHLKQLKIEVETQEALPLWEDAAAEYVRKLRASWIGRDVPIITVPQQFDEAFPALVRRVKTQGRIEIGVEGQQGFVVRALADGGMVFEGKTGKSICEALTALQRRIAQGIGPSGKRGSRLLLHNTNHPEAVEADRRGP